MSPKEETSETASSVRGEVAAETEQVAHEKRKEKLASLVKIVVVVVVVAFVRNDVLLPFPSSRHDKIQELHFQIQASVSIVSRPWNVVNDVAVADGADVVVDAALVAAAAAVV